MLLRDGLSISGFRVLAVVVFVVVVNLICDFDPSKYSRRLERCEDTQGLAVESVRGWADETIG